MPTPMGYTVYMSSLPADLTLDSFHKQLSPILGNIGIHRHWICEKKKFNRFGHLTFLYPQDGSRFMKRHGSEGGKANLRLLGHNVHCRPNDKGVDPTLLRVLIKRQEDEAERKEHAELVPSPPTTEFEISGISCGHYDYPKGQLTYNADIEWNTTRAVAKWTRETLIVTFSSDSVGDQRVEIPYRIIYEVVVSDRPSSLFLTLWEPPRMFQLPSDIDEATRMFSISNLARPNPYRPPTRKRLSYLQHSRENHGEILGQSFVYQMKLKRELLVRNLERLRSIERLEFTTYAVPVVFSPHRRMAGKLRALRSASETVSTVIPFDICYQFEALVQNGYLLPHIVQQLLVRLWDCTSSGRPSDNSKRCPFSAEAVKKLFSQIPFPGPYTEAKMFNPDEIWALIVTNEEKIRSGLVEGFLTERARENLTMVYKVQVTPSRILFSGPEPEAKNRILRKFPKHHGFFARVQFCDEDGQDLHFHPKVSLEEIYTRFKKVLLDGFQIAGRVYGYLGFSHSSLRSHAVWFMATFVDDDGRLRSYVTIIRELGNFQGIRSPAKWSVRLPTDDSILTHDVGAARIGQAFSETPNAVNLKDLNTIIQKMPDVKSRDGERVFSDGVGTISRGLMEAIHDSLPQKSRTATCFQIRWAGAKGMLSLDDTLRGTIMRVRDSMIKFESKDTQNLEICDVANKPIPLVLNRQMIKILEDMGLDDWWFIQAQNQELGRLKGITENTNNTVTFLRRQKVAEQIPLHRFIRRLHRLGFDYKKDRFLCTVVETVVLREVRLLKHRARIPIKNGVTLFGVMDEFGFLEEGQVYITFDQDEDHLYPGLHGRDVILTRSPALHPGDIQICTAVVPPEGHPLRSLSNCVVFSQKGKRDLPSQLSGGDLDGDIYNVIWDTHAVLSCRREFEPADYPRVPPLDKGRDIEREDMTEFFVEFMKTDKLGMIATRHVILADFHPAGTVHEDCKKLAAMHSTAVDYSKTGIPVELRQMPKPLKARPDFLAPAPPANIIDKTQVDFEPPTAPSAGEDEDDDQGPNHLFYRSDKILGKLYRAIDEKKIWTNDIQLVVNRAGDLWKELFEYILSECENLGLANWRGALNDAWNIRQAYEDMIFSATIDFSEHASKSITEIEVFIGSIFNRSGVQTRRQRDTSIRLKDEFDRIAKWVGNVIRKQNDGTGTESESTALELSLACLYVGKTGGSSNVNSTGNAYAKRRHTGTYESFRILAAHHALRELEAEMQRSEARFYE
ncbi:RdRP-domain-containing protein [Poronia punctata]|nr:RdRP-domain-containing protein [Poronia punctata]